MTGAWRAAWRGERNQRETQVDFQYSGSTTLFHQLPCIVLSTSFGVGQQLIGLSYSSKGLFRIHSRVPAAVLSNLYGDTVSCVVKDHTMPVSLSFNHVYRHVPPSQSREDDWRHGHMSSSINLLYRDGTVLLSHGRPP
jgi:hypothetical protein